MSDNDPGNKNTSGPGKKRPDKAKVVSTPEEKNRRASAAINNLADSGEDAVDPMFDHTAPRQDTSTLIQDIEWEEVVPGELPPSPGTGLAPVSKNNGGAPMRTDGLVVYNEDEVWYERLATKALPNGHTGFTFGFSEQNFDFGAYYRKQPRQVEDDPNREPDPLLLTNGQEPDPATTTATGTNQKKKRKFSTGRHRGSGTTINANNVTINAQNVTINGQNVTGAGANPTGATAASPSPPPIQSRVPPVAMNIPAGMQQQGQQLYRPTPMPGIHTPRRRVRAKFLPVLLGAVVLAGAAYLWLHKGPVPGGGNESLPQPPDIPAQFLNYTLKGFTPYQNNAKIKIEATDQQTNKDTTFFFESNAGIERDAPANQKDDQVDITSKMADTASEIVATERKSLKTGGTVMLTFHTDGAHVTELRNFSTAHPNIDDAKQSRRSAVQQQEAIKVAVEKPVWTMIPPPGK